MRAVLAEWRWIGLRALALALALMAGRAEAFTHALLIGVTYADRTDIAHLPGPGNDVAMLRAALIARGMAPGGIRVLADRLPAQAGFAADGRPTRAAIMAGFAELARVSRPGDLVMIHLSGHGSQQPTEVSAEEPDGLDEIFLPEDVGRWDGAVGRVERAIIDDEIGAALDAIRAAGAFVVASFDSCHSGTLTRAAPGRAATRAIPPGVLGIPSVRTTRSVGGAGRSLETLPPVPVPGAGLVALFGSQPWQLVTEISVDLNGSGERTPVGPLSYALARTLREGGGRSWRELTSRVLAEFDLAVLNNGDSRRSDPMVEGDLDAPLPAMAAEPLRDVQAEPQFPGPRGAIRLMAGRLHGLGAGAMLTIHDPVRPDRPLGRARVTAAGLNESLAMLEPAPADFLPRRMLARLPAPTPAGAVRMALPQDELEAGPALRELRAALAGQAGITLVPHDAPADLRLRVAQGRLWLQRGEDAAIAPGSLSMPLGGGVAVASFVAALRHAGAGVRLMQLAPQMASAPWGGQLRIDTQLMRAADRPGGQDPRGACTPYPAQPQAGVEPIRLSQVPRLRHCDVVYVTLRNTGSVPLDVGLFYQHMNGLAYIVPDLHGRGSLAGLRLPGGASLTVPMLMVTWDAQRGREAETGPGRVFVLAARRDTPLALAEVLDYAALLELRQSSGPAQGMAATRGGQGLGGLVQVLRWETERPLGTQ